MKARLLLQILLLFFPWFLRRRLLNHMFGFEISPTARIGWSLLAVRRLTMGPESRVGHLTIARNLELIQLGAWAQIGNRNWIGGLPKSPDHYPASPDREPAMRLDEHAAITSGHRIDCADCVTIGAFSILAGWGSQILTHGIDLSRARQMTEPVKIGRYCFVGTGVIILKGASLPDCCVLGAGALLAHGLSEEWSVYGGVPAKKLGTVERDAAFFSRTVGYVD